MIISGRSTVAIAGPCGTFHIPAEPPETRRVCEGLSRGVWDGEYEHPDIPWDRVNTVLDIGAGWGAFATWVRSKRPNAHIECYDPHALGCDFVRTNDPIAMVHDLAVTSDPAPLFWPGEDWGAQRTVGTPKQFGVPVPAIHPQYLPPCDCLKVDAECAEADILTHYPHRPAVLMVEWHSPVLRTECHRIVDTWGMRMLCDRPAFDGADYGVAIWVKP